MLGSGPGNPDRPSLPFEFAGRAARGALPSLDGAPSPLVIVSHGYPGSRVLMTDLTENLASTGYVVVSIDHTESTHGDAGGFASTRLNRTLDINFVLDRMARKSHRSRGFLSGLVDAGRTAVIDSDRYLLVYESAIHEVSVNPAPPLAELDYREYVHYQEPAWDNRRTNNVNQHFVTAFLGKYLQGDFRHGTASSDDAIGVAATVFDVAAARWPGAAAWTHRRP